MKTIRYWLILGLALFSTAAIHAQMLSYKLDRQKWLSQISTNPIPLMYRFSALIAGSGLQYSEVWSPAVTNGLAGSTSQMSFGTNLSAFSYVDTNLVNSDEIFTTNFPPGNYTLYVESKTVTYRINKYPVAWNVDFATVPPVITNLPPLTFLQATQEFRWPVFNADGAGYTTFVLLEGRIDTNMLLTLAQSASAVGLDAFTNMTVLSAQLRLAPSENHILVTNINPKLGHLVLLQFHNLSAVTTDPLVKEVSSTTANMIVFLPEEVRIVGQPASQTVAEESVISFSVVAVGTPPISYQWQFNGKDILGATNLLLVLANVQTNQSGPYTVVVSNPMGSATSLPAILTVTNAPPPEPLALDEPAMLRPGAFRFLIAGEENKNLAVEFTSNLREWQVLEVITNHPGATIYVDYSVTNAPHRFYRVRVVK